MLLLLKPLRFLYAGAAAATVELFVFTVGTSVGVGVIVSHGISFACGLLVSFLLNKYLVFAVTGKAKKQFIYYVGLAGANLILSTIFIYTLVDIANVHEMLAKIVIMCSVAVWNYFIFSHYIFKNTLG